MRDSSIFIQVYQRTHWVIENQTKGLSNEDALLQLPFRGNCMNWVVGHILSGRNSALKMFGESPALGAEETARYKRDADPLRPGETAVPLDRLLAAISDTQIRLIAALEKMSPADFETIIDEEHQTTISDRLEFSQWHETYHVGQLELLRQLAGVDDKII